ncbi:MAG: Zn-dependent exopeptidase M28, partial [Planctomycetes bacterium]|nr:Zn-dependent exopeptidase M28 [Planctomycetota bacterium]
MPDSSRPTLSPAARRSSRYALLAFAITAGAWGVRGCATPARPELVRERAGQVEPGRAHAWLTELQARHPRRGSPAARASVAFVASAFAEAGLVDVREEVHALGAGRELRNVLGRIPGKDAARCVVLAAHHDTVPQAPGAIDDGGAIAALLEASRALLAGPPPPCDLWVISFDGEERGCLGAKRHLEGLGAEGRAQVQAALAVELVGWTGDDLVVHTIPHGFSWDAEGISPAWVPDGVRGAARALGYRVEVGDPLISPFYQATIRVLGVQTGSDAGAYAERGIPSAMLTGSSLTNFYAGYHTPSDAMPRVDAARLDDAARVIVGAALELGDRAEQGAPRELGGAYLCLGPTTIDRVGLIALALAAAVLALL